MGSRSNDANTFFHDDEWRVIEENGPQASLSCATPPISMNGESHPKGCPGAVWVSGAPSSTYCSGGDNEGMQYPWWKECCKWMGDTEGCVPKDSVVRSLKYELSERLLQRLGCSTIQSIPQWPDNAERLAGSLGPALDPTRSCVCVTPGMWTSNSPSNFYSNRYRCDKTVDTDMISLTISSGVMSSDYETDYPASNAFDGDENTFCHSGNIGQSSLRLNFDSAALANVEITNRKTSREHLGTFDLKYLVDSTWHTCPGSPYTYNMAGSLTQSFSCRTSVDAKAIEIKQHGTDYLNLAEVNIFPTFSSLGSCSTGEGCHSMDSFVESSWSQGCRAYPSYTKKTCLITGTPSKLTIDAAIPTGGCGNPPQSAASSKVIASSYLENVHSKYDRFPSEIFDGCSNDWGPWTAATSTNEWIAVDLSGSKALSKMVLVAGGCCNSRHPKDITLSTGDSLTGPWTVVDTWTGTTATQERIFATPICAQYVRLDFANSLGGSDAIEIDELEIWGTEGPPALVRSHFTRKRQCQVDQRMMISVGASYPAAAKLSLPSLPAPALPAGCTGYDYASSTNSKKDDSDNWDSPQCLSKMSGTWTPNGKFFFFFQ